MTATDDTKTEFIAPTEKVLSRPMTALLAVSVGVIVTNLYTPQTLIGLIGPSLGIPSAADGLITMAALVGYAIGLFFVVPLSDSVENRWLVLVMLTLAVFAAGAAALAPTAAILFAVLVVLGLACSSIQVLVPIAASMVSAEQRGRVVGDVMGGLMVGVLLSRPFASIVADTFGWRAVYTASAVAMGILGLVLARLLPTHRVPTRSPYLILIGSLWHLLREERVLRHRALTAAFVAAAFSLFWTTVALRLANPPFNLTLREIGLFALVGAGGALATPLAGRLGDRGWTRTAMVVAHCLIVVAMALAAWAGSTSVLSNGIGIAFLGLSAIALDVGLSADHTLGRREINLVRPEARGRLNGLYVGLFFLGGSFGAAISGVTWTFGHWPLTCAVCAGFAILALVVDFAWRPGLR
ncbi:MFS transporter (plasmid) [Agrobacterium deltaense]|uniref:MFS transporter n=1 Tax=Agrobacterium deltaense TaxID=1183412 RepID=UPI003D96449B